MLLSLAARLPSYNTPMPSDPDKASENESQEPGAPVTSRCDKAKRWQFGIRDILNLTLAAAIPACFIGYSYRLGTLNGEVASVTLVGAVVSFPPALSWILFTRGYKTAATWVVIPWAIGALTLVIM